MTAAALAPSTERSSSLGPGLRALVENAVGYSTARATQAVERLSGRVEHTVRDVGAKAEHEVEDVAEENAVATGAVTGGVNAALQDRNVVWGALEEMWSGTRTRTKTLIVAAIVVSYLLGPVVLVLLLLALLITMIVRAVRRARS